MSCDFELEALKAWADSSRNRSDKTALLEESCLGDTNSFDCSTYLYLVGKDITCSSNIVYFNARAR
jgi:hypothetical protein